MDNINYDKCKEFISGILQKDWLSEETKNQFLELLNSLNTENAKTVYEKALKLYNNNKSYLNMEDISAGQVMLIVGGTVAVTSYGLNKFCLSPLTKVGIGLTLCGLYMIACK